MSASLVILSVIVIDSDNEMTIAIVSEMPSVSDTDSDSMTFGSLETLSVSDIVSDM